MRTSLPNPPWAAARRILLLAIWLHGSAGSALADGLDASAGFVRREPAYYPNIARRAGIEGRVEVMVHVSASGRVSAVEIRRAEHPMFARWAELAAWLSTYRPATHDGKAVGDSLSVEYRFEAGHHSVHAERGLGIREHIVDLVPNQVCLYGNWLSGPVAVRLSEDRVYIDGIRVYPSMCSFGPDQRPEPSRLRVLREQLAFECRLFERELACRGGEASGIRARTLRMLGNLPVVRGATAPEPDMVRVELLSGQTIDLELPDPFDAEGYAESSTGEGKAASNYFSWLSRLHPVVGRRFVLHDGFATRTMSLANENAMALRRFLASPEAAVNACGGRDLPPGLGDVEAVFAAAIRCPLLVERL